MIQLFNFHLPLRRSARRRLIITTLALLVAYVALSFYGYRFSLQGLLLVLTYWLLVMRLCYSSSVVMSTSFPFIGKKGKNLDERQQSLQNQAYRLAYSIAAPFAVLVGLLDFFGVGASRYFYNQLGFTWLLVYVNMCLVISLPAMCIAWLEPDPIREETPHLIYEGETS